MHCNLTFDMTYWSSVKRPIILRILLILTRNIILRDIKILYRFPMWYMCYLLFFSSLREVIFYSLTFPTGTLCEVTFYSLTFPTGTLCEVTFYWLTFPIGTLCEVTFYSLTFPTGTLCWSSEYKNMRPCFRVRIL